MMDHEGEFSDVLDYEDLFPASQRFTSFTANGIAVRVTGQLLEVIRRRFIFVLGSSAGDVKVVAVHKVINSGPRKARNEEFMVLSRTVAEKRGGNPNIKNAWYGSSRVEISDIMENGFSFMNHTNSVQLVPDDQTYQFILDAAKNSVVDEYGLRHILICQVIMGKSELVPLGSNQFMPSSSEFDSGVDSVSNPTRYFVWTCDVSTHIQPVGVVSFKASDVPAPIEFPNLVASLARFLPSPKIDTLNEWGEDLKANRISPAELKRRIEQEVDGDVLSSVKKSLFVPSRSDYGIRVSDLMPFLETYLSHRMMALVTKSHCDFRAKKINRDQMVRRLHTMAGDELLKKAVRELEDKEPHL